MTFPLLISTIGLRLGEFIKEDDKDKVRCSLRDRFNVIKSTEEITAAASIGVALANVRRCAGPGQLREYMTGRVLTSGMTVKLHRSSGRQNIK